MDKRQLRLALQEKLEHRRRLMGENAHLRGDVSRLEDRNKFLVEVLGNPLVNRALEDCADHIMRSVMEHAVKASEVVADQTQDSGDYEIGISIPSLHIRHRIYRPDLQMARVGGADMVDDRIALRSVGYDGTRA